MPEGTSHREVLVEQIQKLGAWFEEEQRLRRLVGGWAVSLGLLGAGVVVVNAPEARIPVIEQVAAPPESMPPPIRLSSTTAPTTSTTLPPETTTTIASPETTLPPETTTPQPAVPSALANTLQPEVFVPVPVIGVDVSWPTENCNATMPPGIQFGIVGINEGENFTHNGCVDPEKSWFAHVWPYLNSDYPGLEAALPYQNQAGAKTCAADDENCLAYNYGYAAGFDAFGQMDQHNLLTDTVYIDVETGNYWSHDNKVANVQSLQGQMDAIDVERAKRQLAPANFVIYSNPHFWETITDNWQSGLDMWQASGEPDMDTALMHCSGYDFTGQNEQTGRVGRTIMVQYVNTVHDEYPGDSVDLDNDGLC